MVILVGVGLANACLALALIRLRPDISITLVDHVDGRGRRPSQTWSFHDSDVGENPTLLNEPWVQRWPCYDVQFPSLSRTLESGYASIASDAFWPAFDARIQAAGVKVIAGKATRIESDGVWLENGERLEGALVVDGRGRPATESRAGLGFQKFVGQVLQLREPHGLRGPCLMDATVEQRDGYRFVYVLPLSEFEVLVEDTYYSDGPELNSDELKIRIAQYAQSRGWAIERVVREEVGCLPIPLTLETMFRGVEEETSWKVPRVGMGGGLFHAVTGYSLPSAVTLAEKIASLPELSTEIVLREVRAFREARRTRDAFYCFLNRMLFRAARPEQRFRILQRFYGLSAELIGRFYRGDWRWADAVRILAGKPPVPILSAVRCVRSGVVS